MTHSAFNDVLPMIGRAAAGLRFEDLPAHVVMRVKQRVSLSRRAEATAR